MKKSGKNVRRRGFVLETKRSKPKSRIKKALLNRQTTVKGKRTMIRMQITVLRTGMKTNCTHLRCQKSIVITLTVTKKKVKTK